MIFRNQDRVVLLMLCIATLLNSGCTGNVQSTPLPTVPAATQTPSPQPVDTRTPTPDEAATAYAIETASIR